MSPIELLQVALLLFVWSFLYKENVFFRISEKIFVAITVGQTICITIDSLWKQNVTRLIGGEFILLIPTLLGVTYLLRLNTKYKWASRYPNALLIGVGMGMSIRAIPYTVQIYMSAMMKNLLDPNNILIFIACITTIFYFFFMRKPGRIADPIAKIGRAFILFNLGTVAAGVFLSRLSYLVDMLKFILRTFNLITV